MRAGRACDAAKALSNWPSKSKELTRLNRALAHCVVVRRSDDEPAGVINLGFLGIEAFAPRPRKTAWFGPVGDEEAEMVGGLEHAGKDAREAPSIVLVSRQFCSPA